MKVVNLNYLEKRWLASKAGRIAIEKVTQLPATKLAHLLRHHTASDMGVSDLEIGMRHEFDSLLAFYGIVEIATMIGFVKELPREFRLKHLPVLRNGAVRRYYKRHYSLDLPLRLSERMQSGGGYQVSRTGELDAAFYEFLELTTAFERDGDVESFLWCLDGGQRRDEKGESNLDEVRKELANPARLAEAVQQPEDEQSEVDAALCGFCKFIQLCEGLDSLLKRLKKYPEVAEAMWLAHGYWFRRMGGKLGADLKRTIQCLAEWNVDENDRKALRARITALEGLVQSLASPPMTDRDAGGSAIEGAKAKGGILATEAPKAWTHYITVYPTPTARQKVKIPPLLHKITQTMQRKQALKTLIEKGYVPLTHYGKNKGIAEISASAIPGLLKTLRQLTKVRVMKGGKATQVKPIEEELI